MMMTPNSLLVHYGELALKGRNRDEFEMALRENLKQRLQAEGLRWPVRRHHGQIFIDINEPGSQPLDQIQQILADMAGVATVALAYWRGAGAGHLADLAWLEEAIVTLATAEHVSGGFAVRVQRADKRFPIPSDALERRLGALILARTPWTQVNLKQPARIFHVDIHPAGIGLYTHKLQGIGGLPVFTGGHALALLSGGIDSPVAAFLMAKRGCRVDFLHLTASHVQLHQLVDNPVVELVRMLSRYTLRSRLYLAPNTHFDLALSGQHTGYEVILLRRFIQRLGAVLAARWGAAALVSGDSLGQVASQTLENLIAAEQAAELPVLRPLIGYDKQEIITVARRIGTYAISIQPYKDCCALLNRNPRTRSNHLFLAQMEQQLLPDYAQLLETTLAEGRQLDFAYGRLVDAQSATTHPAALDLLPAASK